MVTCVNSSIVQGVGTYTASAGSFDIVPDFDGIIIKGIAFSGYAYQNGVGGLANDAVYILTVTDKEKTQFSSNPFRIPPAQLNSFLQLMTDYGGGSAFLPLDVELPAGGWTLQASMRTVAVAPGPGYLGETVVQIHWERKNYKLRR